MSASITPRVFVSAASSDLRSARKVVNDALTRIECLPIEESVFGTEYGPIREMIARKIESCQAVIHLVGRDFGGEPDPRTLPADQPRRSWTQIEYDLAKEQKPKQKLYLLVCDDAFPFDPPAVPEPADKSAVQLAHRQAVLADRHLWHTVRTLDELRRQIENLKVPLDEVRAELRRQQMRHIWLAGLAGIVIGLMLFCVISILSQLEKKVQQVDAKVSVLPDKIEEAKQDTVRQLSDPVALAATIRKQIETAAEAKIAEISKKEPGWPQKIAEIGQWRVAQLGRVDNLIQLIQDGLKGSASKVFQQAVDILNDEKNGGIDAAITYLKSCRPNLLEMSQRHAVRADAEKAQRNNSLQALVLEADLLGIKLQCQPALELREQVAELAPDWFQARIYLGNLLGQLARNREAEPHYRAALALAATPGDEAIALNNLALLLEYTKRPEEAEILYRRALATDEKTYGVMHPNVAIDLNNLALLLKAADRLVQAEALHRRALSIDEKFYGADNHNVATDLSNLALLLEETKRLTESELLKRRSLAIFEQSFGPDHRNVATLLNNLALMLQATNRLAQAEPLMRRALAIDEQSDGAEHPKVALRLNNLAQLLQATNRLAQAEPLMRRALSIDEQSDGAEHPNVARDLNNLSQLFQATNRLAEAEPLMRRALAIDMQSYGAEHSLVANRLSNLATLLLATNRRAEAEPLMRHALTIEEQLYGAEHSNVAIRLNNLAKLLQATDRLEAAETLMRQHVVIFLEFKRRTGQEHPHLRAAFTNYSELLKAMKLPAEKIEERLEHVRATTGPLKKIVPEVEQLLGPAKPVADVLAALDRQYKADGKPAVYFLPPSQPIAPHLDELLGKSKLDVPLDEPIVPHLDKLLGPAKSTQEVFETLDRQYREQGKSEIWFLPLSEPIAPHLDELLGPVPVAEKKE